ncbi:hypothetical protein HN652_00890 [archaeon]|jgi:2-iminoacetate synthase|nr:hypothetical protein [archaeon]MBT6868953.1 hypothetical protein [archaeon]MBT7192826.1 hypothetical protein [archaeon]MBT7380792.1 hypothetical protein [archaeon]MBT7507547.1 hypothetical protein [archaeon]
MILQKIVNAESLMGQFDGTEPSSDLFDRLEQKVEEKIFPGEEVIEMLKFKDELSNEIVSRATELNFKKFGKVIDFYAVSYISDHCVNNCSYCGHSSGLQQKREKLGQDLIRKDFAARLKYGPTDICILTGEHPKLITPEYLAIAGNIAIEEDIFKALENVTFNVAPMGKDDLNKLRKGINFPLQFRIFQESYHLGTYIANHTKGPKSDILFRMEIQDRSLESGFDNVGIGALLGINNDHTFYKNSGHDFEVLSLVRHGFHLHEKFAIFPKTVSIPRVQKADGNDYVIPNSVEDSSYVTFHGILRLALPETKIIITNRENVDMVETLQPMINVRDLAARPGVGGNYRSETHLQNVLGDTNSSESMVNHVKHCGYIANVACERLN